MIRSVFIRYILPIAAALSIIAFVGVPYIEHMLTDWFRADIELRARLVMNSMEEPLAGLLERNESARLAAYLERVVSDERLLAVLICDTRCVEELRHEPRPGRRHLRFTDNVARQRFDPDAPSLGIDRGVVVHGQPGGRTGLSRRAGR